VFVAKGIIVFCIILFLTFAEKIFMWAALKKGTREENQGKNHFCQGFKGCLSFNNSINGF
jgi:hypothetical protein